VREGAPAFLLRLAVALAAGALWGLAQGRDTWPLASWVVVAPLLALLAQPRPLLSGFAFGFASWLVAIPWIVPTLVTYGAVAPPLALALFALLAAYLALFVGAFALLAAPLWRRAGPGATGLAAAAALVATPAVWVALEWLRTYLLGGFPWNLAGYAWERVPGALPFAAWVGAYGVSFLVLFANAGAALAVRRRSLWPAAVGLLVPLALLPIGGRWAAGTPAGDEGGVLQDVAAAEAGEPVSVVQPNIPNRVVPDWPTIHADYARLLALSHRACSSPGTLVVWPESAAWPYDYYRDESLRRDLDALTAAGCPVLLNALTPTGGSFYNSALLVGAGGGGGSGEVFRYDKRHLVPFGEYVPFAGAFAFLDKLARNSGALTAADSLRLLPWGREQLGLAICFEVVFPAEVAAAVRAGATVLVTITNDAWYGDTSAPHQHFRAARFRAAENRRPLVRAAITGISGLIAPDGRVRARLGVGAQGVLHGRVAGRTDLSPYTRAPWLVPLACSVVGGFGILMSSRKRSAP
jgi:apolipoprotein N-acyltransferase